MKYSHVDGTIRIYYETMPKKIYTNDASLVVGDLYVIVLIGLFYIVIG